MTTFNLRRVEIPVTEVGATNDPGDVGAVGDWLTYFAGELNTMASTLLCNFTVRLSLDVAERMYDSALPETEPSDPLPLLSQCGLELSKLRVFLDRNAPSNSILFE